MSGGASMDRSSYTSLNLQFDSYNEVSVHVSIHVVLKSTCYVRLHHQCAQGDNDTKRERERNREIAIQEQIEMQYYASKYYTLRMYYTA